MMDHLVVRNCRSSGLGRRIGGRLLFVVALTQSPDGLGEIVLYLVVKVERIFCGEHFKGSMVGHHSLLVALHLAFALGQHQERIAK